MGFAESKEKPDTVRDASRLLKKLYQVRKQIGENVFEPQLSKLIAIVREEKNYSEKDFEERILYAIEVQGSITRTEISEDTGLKKDFVEKAVENMKEKGLLDEVSRFVQGSGRPQTMLKSTRVDSVEVFEI